MQQPLLKVITKDGIVIDGSVTQDAKLPVPAIGASEEDVRKLGNTTGWNQFKVQKEGQVTAYYFNA